MHNAIFIVIVNFELYNASFFLISDRVRGNIQVFIIFVSLRALSVLETTSEDVICAVGP